MSNGPQAPENWRAALVRAQASARCGARTRSGAPCSGPAMPNGRCRMHGGASTGPRTAEGRERCRTASWKHGRRAAEAREAARLRGEARRLIAALCRL